MIVYCCPDLLFATKIRSTAEALGLTSRPARDAQTLQNRLNRVDDGKGNGAVSGVVVDLDLGELGLAMVEQAKRHDPGLLVVAYGSHVAVDALQAARKRGADFVMPRGALAANLPAMLERLAGGGDSTAPSDRTGPT